ncbi:uncharacterized protein LOC130628892 [Hydractinia symbiolongicarpus]|uniref:uncharacterized protein LOC130628892 n=1 Tax=Hydractinia symbiolongicarpus TaxID=13093 RepID=UPI00254D5A90|nr:uncharacterized protein LOC130628892 [Hydractinia symbiolongicarpus]
MRTKISGKTVRTKSFAREVSSFSVPDAFNFRAIIVFKILMAYHCAVFNSANGAYKLKKWKEAVCEDHNVKKSECSCEPPFRLYPFPTTKKNPEKRKMWIQLLNRLAPGSKDKLFEPSKDARVCSEHFLDGKPTECNPHPTENMGYDSRKKTSLLFKSPSQKKPRKNAKAYGDADNCLQITEDVNITNLDDKNNVDNSISTFVHVTIIIASFIALIMMSLKRCLNVERENRELKNNNIKLKTKSAKLSHLLNQTKLRKRTEKYHNHIFVRKSVSIYKEIITSDKKCNFYTNINNREAFEYFHDAIKPHVCQRFHHTKSEKNQLKKFGRTRKLYSKDEFLLVLTKLRLGVLFEDLADRFKISVATTFSIFAYWIRAMSEFFSCMVYMPDQERIRENMPKRFKKFIDLVAIIDCSEVFIETPKDLELQSATWSDYKHHNTMKFLISVTPSSFINFVSEPYTGRISDKALTLDSEFLDIVPHYSRVMADKGFNIANECAARSIYFTVPPGKRGTSQMTPSEVRKISNIAKLRILVEQVI